MTNITSERIRLANLERDLRQKAYLKQTGIEFREYILKLVNMLAEKNARIENKSYHACITKFLSSIVREIEELNIEKQECEKDAHRASVAFDALFDDKEEPSVSNDYILSMSDEVSKKICESEEIEKSYLKQKFLCIEIEKAITKLSRQIEKTPNKNYSDLLAEIIEQLKIQQTDEISKYNDLKNKYEAADYKAREGLDEFVEEIRRINLKKDKQRGE